MTKESGAVLLGGVGTLCCVLGWVGWVVGPRGLALLDVAGFLCGVVGVVVSRDGKVNGARSWQGLGGAVRRGKMAAGILTVVCVAFMLAGAWDAGVADYPALEVRPRYELNNHGVRTEVPRWRYVVVSMAFGTGWHAMAVLANMVAVSRRLHEEQE